jgi:hypothetical protein
MSQIAAEKALIDKLVEYLKTELDFNGPGQAHSEFPAATATLNLPAMSVSVMGQPDYIPTPGEELEDDSVTVGAGPEVDALYRVARLSMELAIDIFGKNKVERSEIAHRVIEIMNPELGESTGLKLTLDKYYNRVASFVITGTGFVDNESGSQRNEWRYRYVVTADVDLVVLSRQVAIQEITVDGTLEELDESSPSVVTIDIQP